MKKVFVDTNYFLRFLIRGDEEQFQTVSKLLKDGLSGKVVLVTDEVVIFEIYWVLKSFYKIEKEECVRLLIKILELSFIEIEKRSELLVALSTFSKENIELEDGYHLACSVGKKCDELATFDEKMRKVWHST